MINVTKYRQLLWCALISAAAALAQPLAAQVLYTENGFFGTTVGSYSPSTGAPINPALISGTFGLASIAVDNQGYLYTDNYFEGVIGKYAAATGAPVNPTLITEFDGLPYLFAGSIAADDAGHLFVASGSGIYTFDTSSGAQVGSVIPPSGSNFVATDSANDLYVASPDSLSEYSPGGTELWTEATSVGDIQDLTIDSDGSLFTADGSNGTVAQFDAATGQLLNPDFITGLGWADSVATDGAGDLFVSSQSSIGEYSAVTGAVINADLISQGGDLIRYSPLGGASTAVPDEAATMGLLAIGLAVVLGVRFGGIPARAAGRI